MMKFVVHCKICQHVINLKRDLVIINDENGNDVRFCKSCYDKHLASYVS